jgi:SrtB family sortase
MNKHRMTTLGKTLIAVVIALALGLLAGILRPDIFGFGKQTAAATPSATVEPSASAEPTSNADQEDYDSRKAVNPEYVGELVFDSGLVDQNVVQAADNEKYLTLAWDLTSSTHGAAFLDYRNSLSDQNLIIYGHFVYADETLMFSPLHALKDSANYKTDQYLDLKMGSETRRYEVTDVYYYKMGDESMMYYLTNYDSQYFDTYYKTVKANDFYDTGESLTMEDHWISLQTCVRDRDDLRLIVLAKQIDN